MVNTRRSESHSIRHHHQTRHSTKLVEQDTGSSSIKEESDSERLNSDDETSSNAPLIKPQEQVKKRSITKIASPTRETHKEINIERRRLAVYANRKMSEEIMDNEQFSEDDDFYPMLRRPNRLVKKRMLRRTALSLRPLRQKSYVDPSYFDTDSDGVLKRVTRRSGNLEASWLGDSQMHKVGYPNLNVPVGYSEEDSRDAADESLNVEIAPSATRHSRRRPVKPAYYYEEYDDVPQIRRSRKSVRRVVTKVRMTNIHEELSNTDANSKEKKEGLKGTLETTDTKPRLSETKTDDTISKSSKDSVDAKEQTSVKKELENGNKSKDDIPTLVEEEEVQQESKTLSSRQSRLRLRQNQRHKVSESEISESEDDGAKKYSLRNRVPKPAPKNMQTSVLRPDCERRSHRRFTRRRRKSSSSSDSSSSSSDNRRRKQPKNQHSKKEMMKTGAGGSNIIAPIKPETLDQSVRFHSIGGLDGHIQCLKEMIMLPMMYREVFSQFQVQPPRGVLFHGPPGTGKTLIARALANECSQGARKVSFFMRKGADLLSKWIGESEKQLRLLFEQASEMKPSIIFFDELDGLAPVRSSRQDQVHASIVSTLLALMDGLNDRGEVIVIGATNRIDAIDPALRRPGRFDRELFFPLPSKLEREEILKVHVSKWTQPPSTELLKYLAENTVGYCGSDLRALCSEAVIQSLRRTYPQVYGSEHKLLFDPKDVKVEKVDFLRAKSMLVPASQRVASGLGKKLLPILNSLLQPVINEALSALELTFPHGFKSELAKVKLSTNLRPAQFLLTGNGPEHGQSYHVAPSLLFHMEHIHSYLLDLATLYREPGRTPEEACIQIFNEARKNVPSIIYIPCIDQWWELVTDTVRAIFLSQMKAIDPNVPILLLATAEVIYDDLPLELQNMFLLYRKEVQEIGPPNSEARRSFFKALLIDMSLKPVRKERERPKTPPPLLRAPTPPPSPITEQQAQKLYDKEEHTLRELRIFLRDMCKKLASNKLFFMFTKPVDTEEVPDYTEIIKQPMDLETMMMKVDFHRYECAKDFLTDIDLICRNALEYNPAKSSADKQIRHRACSLRDYAYTLIKTEMDSDFEDKCQDIKKERKHRNVCTSKYLPAYMITTDLGRHQINLEVPKETNQPTDSTADKTTRISSTRKRKVYNWRHGYLRKPVKRTKLDSSNGSSNKSKENISSDDSKNDPDSSTMEMPPLRENDSKSSDVYSPLSINCDTQKADSSSISGRLNMSKLQNELLSPSELLDSPLYFDDVDQALHENDKVTSKSIVCCQSALEKILEETIECTENLPLSQLLDLYNQLSGIIKKFSNTHIRRTLPKELSKELDRFKQSINYDISENASSI